MEEVKLDASAKLTTTTDDKGIKRTAIILKQSGPNQSSPLQATQTYGGISIDILLPDTEQLLRLNIAYRDKEWANVDVIWLRPEAKVRTIAWYEGERVMEATIPKGSTTVAVDMNWEPKGGLDWQENPMEIQSTDPSELTL